MRRMLVRSLLALSLAVATLTGVAGLQTAPPALPRRDVAATLPGPAAIADLRAYIKRTWSTLTRTLADLPSAVRDPKFPRPNGEPWPLYVTADQLPLVSAELDAALAGAARLEVVVRALPADRSHIRDHGLLYLPRPYVVPGGRFNEMYGWDSYFILAGLVRDDEVARARDLVDNFVYQITHYGTILNANRTYYLSRSQPPLLTRMILAVFEATGDREWLGRTWPAGAHTTGYWLAGEHRAGDTGLSRYFDFGEGPAPEVVTDERDDQGRTHYDRAREFYRTRQVTDYARRRLLRPRRRCAHAALLQGRSDDARVGLRPLEQVRALQRRHRATRPRVPQQPAVSDGA